MSSKMVVAVLVLFCGSTLVLAAQKRAQVQAAGKGKTQQIRKRDQTCLSAKTQTGAKIQQRDRLKDGSCTAKTAAKTQTGTQIQQRDRLKDGSCTAKTAAKTQTGTQIQQRDQLKDGSCLLKTAAKTQTGDQIQQRDRLKDGSCQ